jgi:hypothetical protein
MADEIVVELDSFPKPPTITIPTMDDIKRQAIANMVSYKKKPYVTEEEITERIGIATAAGKRSLSLSKDKVRAKELLKFDEMGYRILPGKRKGGCLSRLCKINEIRISWK